MKTHLPKESRQIHCIEPNCNYTALCDSSLKKHKLAMHTNANNLSFTCPRCLQGFALKGGLKEHSAFCCDPAERPHQCTNCGKRFKLKQHLEIHYHDIHNMSTDEARALVYPGLPVRSWSGACRNPNRTSKMSNETN